MVRGPSWSDSENQATVRAYLRILEAQVDGVDIVKREVIREVEDWTDRTRGAVEYKFQNVSAVLRDMGLIFAKGYQPAKNYQMALSQAVRAQLAGRPELADRLVGETQESPLPARRERT